MYCRNIVFHKHPVPSKAHELPIEDLNFLLTCQLSREENMFHLRLHLIQGLDSNRIHQLQVFLNELRQICGELHALERRREVLERPIIERFRSCLSDAQSQKQLAYKLCLKIAKINTLFFQKLQSYFPKFAELLAVDSLEYGNSVKEVAQYLLHSLSSNGNLQQNQQLTLEVSQDTLPLIINKSRQRFQREMGKVLNWSQNYSLLADKYGRLSDRNSKSEKLLNDKYLFGVESVVYVCQLLKKYFLGLERDEKRSNTQNEKFMGKKNTSAQLHRTQFYSNLVQNYKNPYDVIYFEDLRKAPNLQIQANPSPQNTNGAAYSAASQPQSQSQTQSQSQPQSQSQQQQQQQQLLLQQQQQQLQLQQLQSQQQQQQQQQYHQYYQNMQQTQVDGSTLFRAYDSLLEMLAFNLNKQLRDALQKNYQIQRTIRAYCQQYREKYPNYNQSQIYSQNSKNAHMMMMTARSVNKLDKEQFSNLNKKFGTISAQQLASKGAQYDNTTNNGAQIVANNKSLKQLPVLRQKNELKLRTLKIDTKTLEFSSQNIFLRPQNRDMNDTLIQSQIIESLNNSFTALQLTMKNSQNLPPISHPQHQQFLRELLAYYPSTVRDGNITNPSHHPDGHQNLYSVKSTVSSPTNKELTNYSGQNFSSENALTAALFNKQNSNNNKNNCSINAAIVTSKVHVRKMFRNTQAIYSSNQQKTISHSLQNSTKKQDAERLFLIQQQQQHSLPQFRFDDSMFVHGVNQTLNNYVNSNNTQTQLVEVQEPLTTGRNNYDGNVENISDSLKNLNNKKQFTSMQKSAIKRQVNILSPDIRLNSKIKGFLYKNQEKYRHLDNMNSSTKRQATNGVNENLIVFPTVGQATTITACVKEIKSRLFSQGKNELQDSSIVKREIKHAKSPERLSNNKRIQHINQPCSSAKIFTSIVEEEKPILEDSIKIDY